MNADQVLVDSLVGLKPDENLHDFVLHFEPVCLLFLNKITKN